MAAIGRVLALAAASVALLAVPSAASAATVTNGDFETGTLSGWQTQVARVAATGSRIRDSTPP